ncbi:MAG TPA: hypothetical protein PKW06_07785 [Cyclobacteriaceae bacterium]|nr:hypothetical protein [Cyclobacteriaceae bacterium]MCB9236793.1 hypothetical protein [Flammeovirgaceae bacterium]MCB0498640.1 hypothetical protein [Cyclobacteriaceae bacterium]MCO5272322.1 hypothetical protein [Cyclobacteriaceae bacterium]MCW5902072.1 hypothetical protein [Cyclobacteriaceae bacterium]
MDQKLKLSSKKLKSGKFQVSFSTVGVAQECYGYMLAEPKTSVHDVIAKINRHVQAMQTSDLYHQRNLFSLGKREINSGRILIYKR